MKKFSFFLAILIGAGILVALSFSKEDGKTNAKNTTNIDFSEGEKLYTWDAHTKQFKKKDSLDKNGGEDTFYLHTLSPADGIYYKSSQNNPFVLKKRGNLNIITLSSGLFVCNIQTGLEKYEFHIKDINVTPKGRGVFFVDNTGEKAKIFSFDAFLNTELVSGTKRTSVANFLLFPSLFFEHDKSNTLELKGADILRISIIDTIRYVDIKTPEEAKILLSSDTLDTNKEFLAESQKDINSRINGFTELYTSVINSDDTKIKKTSFFNENSALLINGSKKEIFLKNTLTENIHNLLKNTQSTKRSSFIQNIKESLSQMRDLGPNSYNEGLSILKQYYYIATFSHFSNKDNLLDFASEEAPLLLETEKIITNSTGLRQGEYYTHLSDLFAQYYFFSLNQENLGGSLQKILQKILEKKVLSKNEFLPFTFFTTQYLSNGPIAPNKDTLSIVTHLMRITNDYYENNKSDDARLATITSTIFYNYTKIFTKVYNVFLLNFMKKVPEGLLLKDEYISAGDSNFDQNFKDVFTKTIEIVIKDSDEKKQILEMKELTSSDPLVMDNYSLLKKTLKNFEPFIAIFNNYPKYLNDFNLNDSNRSAKGILIDTSNDMSMEILQTYLKNFNQLDIGSLQVKNNFQKDGFYEVQVTIFGNIFNFKLYQQNHNVSDISYIDNTNKRHAFPNITISLDQKEEQLKDLLGSANEPALQYKYDFKNFFEITFLKGNSTIVPTDNSPKSDPNEDIGTTSPEIQLFVQKELLDKDFKNIAGFFPIGFKNIQASIKDGTYVIKLKNIIKSFAGNGENYTTEMGSSYIFNRHTFSKLVFKIKKEGDEPGYEFNDTNIEIMPPRIALLSLPDTIKNLGFYLDIIKKSYTNQKSIVIDLIGKKVLLDNVPFVPEFPTE